MRGYNFRRIGAVDFCTSVGLVHVFPEEWRRQCHHKLLCPLTPAGLSRFDTTDCQQTVKLCEWIEVGSHGSGRVPCATRRSALHG